jgi:ribonucleoside-diphosphate reductase alpha chain
MAADRGAYICQSQSLNIFMENVNFAKLTSMHFYSWKAGLKTGMYYLRTKAATDAIKFTLDKATIANNAAAEVASKANGVPVGSTVMLEPVISGPVVTSNGAARVETHAVVQDANDHNGPILNEVAAQRAAALRQAEAERAQAEIACSLDNPEGCEMCSG